MPKVSKMTLTTEALATATAELPSRDLPYGLSQISLVGPICAMTSLVVAGRFSRTAISS